MTASTVGVPVRTDRFVRLVDFLREKGSDRDPVDAIEGAIDYWIQNANWKTDDLMPEVFERQNYRGYQWKSQLLPPGTQVRMTYKGDTYHAAIEGDDFIYEGKKSSPSDFANTVASGTSRNAWRDLWIKRPQDHEFRLADSLRPPPKPELTLEDLHAEPVIPLTESSKEESSS
jgi:hypothetical protein